MTDNELSAYNKGFRDGQESMRAECERIIDYRYRKLFAELEAYKQALWTLQNDYAQIIQNTTIPMFIANRDNKNGV